MSVAKATASPYLPVTTRAGRAAAASPAATWDDPDRAADRSAGRITLRVG